MLLLGGPVVIVSAGAGDGRDQSFGGWLGFKASSVTTKI
jgi:hypothetical protein